MDPWCCTRCLLIRAELVDAVTLLRGSALCVHCVFEVAEE